MTASTTSTRKRVMGPQLMFGWESSITRTSVLPDRWHPTMNIGLSMVLSPLVSRPKMLLRERAYRTWGRRPVEFVGWVDGLARCGGWPPMMAACCWSRRWWRRPTSQVEDDGPANGGGGRPERTEQEWCALLADTGFVLAGIRPFRSGSILKAVPTPSQTQPHGPAR
jgi:hypothetical protein